MDYFKSADELIKKLMTVEEAKQTLRSYSVIYKEYKEEKDKYDHWEYELRTYKTEIETIENKEYYIEQINDFLPIYIKDKGKRNVKNTRIKALEGKYPFNSDWKYELLSKHSTNKKFEYVNSITIDDLNTYNADNEKAKISKPKPSHDKSILNDESKRHIFRVYKLFKSIYDDSVKILKYNNYAEYESDENNDVVHDVIHLFNSLKYNCYIKDVNIVTEEDEDREFGFRSTTRVTQTNYKKICLSI